MSLALLQIATRMLGMLEKKAYPVVNGGLYAAKPSNVSHAGKHKVHEFGTRTRMVDTESTPLAFLQTDL